MTMDSTKIIIVSSLFGAMVTHTAFFIYRLFTVGFVEAITKLVVAVSLHIVLTGVAIIIIASCLKAYQVLRGYK